MNEHYWADQDTQPSQLPIIAREAWHRDAWDREQMELGAMVGSNATEFIDSSSITYEALLGEESAR